MLSQPFLLFLRYETPEFVNVDGRAPVLVAGEVEMTHTNFTEVTRMVFIKVSSVNWRFSCNGHKKNDVARTDGDVDHQQDHDLLDVCGACLHVHDRPIHGHGACEFSRTEMALFSVKDSLHQSTAKFDYIAIQMNSNPSS